ncbi:Rho-GTPase-activating protein 8 [Malassezia sp. CBS 17886]|nr:Rho-GTPase-activating protein 8 [Malassezia sp. CBS 17886]
MTAPSQLGITYPSTFANSFWTHPEYRTGATVLYSRLQDGLDEDAAVLDLLKQRAQAERAYARLLSQEPVVQRTAEPLFAGAASSSPNIFRTANTPTARAFRALTHEVVSNEAEKHFHAAKAIEATILDPFTEWADAHAARIQQSWDAVDDALCTVERQGGEVGRLRATYEAKCRVADEAEDDARFAPSTHVAALEASDALSPRTRRLSLATRAVSSPVTSSAPPPASPAAQPHSSASSAAGDEGVTQTDATSDDPAQPLDASRVRRRETLRQQFGFKTRSATQGGDAWRPSAAAARADADGLERSPSTRISTYLTRAVGRMGDSPAIAQVRAAVSGFSDPRHVRLRRDAESAEAAYQEAVMALDAYRCVAEEVLFQQYQLAQRWEADRVVALQRVLSALHQALHPMADALQGSMEQTRVLPDQLHPTAQLRYLTSEFQTGPFRPAPHVFRPYYHDDLVAASGASTAGFGMDLVSTARGEALAAQDAFAAQPQQGSMLTMPTLPPVLHALLSALQRSYADNMRWASEPRADGSAPAPRSAAERNAEKRRVWLYDVPLPVTHAFRAKLIAHAASDAAERRANSRDLLIPDTLLDAASAPVLAAAVKLWALELDSPLLPNTLWDEAVEIYDAAERTLRSGAQGDAPDAAAVAAARQAILQGLGGVLAQLPKLHLTCLDALISHLYKLVKNTPTDEGDDLATSKLGLALGRCVLRPTAERPSTVQAKYPALVVKDFITHYETLFPPLMHTKAKEPDAKVLSPFRSVPIRRRSKPVDERISRSSLQGLGAPPAALQRRATQVDSRNARAVRGASPVTRQATTLAYRSSSSSAATNSGAARPNARASGDVTARGHALHSAPVPGAVAKARAKLEGTEYDDRRTSSASGAGGWGSVEERGNVEANVSAPAPAAASAPAVTPPPLASAKSLANNISAGSPAPVLEDDARGDGTPTKTAHAAAVECADEAGARDVASPGSADTSAAGAAAARSPSDAPTPRVRGPRGPRRA